MRYTRYTIGTSDAERAFRAATQAYNEIESLIDMNANGEIQLADYLTRSEAELLSEAQYLLGDLAKALYYDKGGRYE